jgi:hypothetical protein
MTAQPETPDVRRRGYEGWAGRPGESEHLKGVGTARPHCRCYTAPPTPGLRMNCRSCSRAGRPPTRCRVRQARQRSSRPSCSAGFAIDDGDTSLVRARACSSLVRTEAVASLAGSKASNCNSATVTSTAVPKWVRLVSGWSSPSLEESRRWRKAASGPRSRDAPALGAGDVPAVVHAAFRRPGAHRDRSDAGNAREDTGSRLRGLLCRDRAP